MSHNHHQEFAAEHHEVLHSIRTSRIILPILLGLAAVGYLFWRHFDLEEFSRINWTAHTYFWLFTAVALSVLWHLTYSYRLRELTLKEFSWWKSIELIAIWEFSSAVSPTSLGGSAVAFFILAQEKLPAARTATIVLYTIVLDSMFLLTTVPILYIIFGNGILRPGAETFADAGIWGLYFLIAFLIMLTYTLPFIYGLFINPAKLEQFLGAVTNNRLLRRYHEKARVFGHDMAVASRNLKKHDWRFHAKAIASTIVVWTLRFLIISSLLIAFLPDLPLDPRTQFELYARLETMFFVIAFSPTPGGAGLIDLVFSGFLTDYIHNPTQGAMIATIWRLISYYIYLFLGAFIVPNWIRKRINERRARMAEKMHEHEG